MRSRITPNLSLLPLFLSAVCVSNAAPLVQEQSNQTSYSGITWTTCPKELPSELQCANFTVPLDWGDPLDTDTVQLSLVKLAAKDPASRIGNLFINPGGPGVSAIQDVAARAAGLVYIGAEIRAKFDIIGVDPRGIGHSSPVKCDRDIWNERFSLFPSSEAEFKALVDHNRRAGNSCREKSGRLIDFMDTVSVVRDHEAVREALGDEPLNWLGLSYGTQIGSQYAELFPNNYRAIVLDGNLQHSQGESSNLLIEATAYENELKRFFQWCDNNSTCAIRGNNYTAAQAWGKLLKKATKSPIPAPGCNDANCRSNVTAEEIRFAVDGLVVGSPDTWPMISEAVSEALDANATLFSRYNPLFVGADADAVDASQTYGFLAVSCQDWTHATRSWGELSNKLAAARTYAPRTQGASQSYQIQVQCLGWPSKITNPPHKLRVPESAPGILLVNSYYDPSTSYVWGTGMMDEIHGQRVMLSRDGDGHTSYNNGGKTAQATEKYFLTTKLPTAGKVLST